MTSIAPRKCYTAKHFPEERGLVFKAHRRVYHSTLGWRVTKKKRKQASSPGPPASSRPLEFMRELTSRAMTLNQNSSQRTWTAFRHRAYAFSGINTLSRKEASPPCVDLASRHNHRRLWLVFKAHRFVHHSTLDWRVTKKKKEQESSPGPPASSRPLAMTFDLPKQNP